MVVVTVVLHHVLSSSLPSRLSLSSWSPCKPDSIPPLHEPQVGIFLGQHKYTVRSCQPDTYYQRSLEGSCCVFVVGVITVVLMYAVSQSMRRSLCYASGAPCLYSSSVYFQSVSFEIFEGTPCHKGGDQFATEIPLGRYTRSSSPPSSDFVLLHVLSSRHRTSTHSATHASWFLATP